MVTVPTTDQPSLTPADQEELTKLVNAVALSDNALTLFAIAPESAPDHPAVVDFKTQLGELDESLQFLTFFYSDNSLFNFLTHLDSHPSTESGRRVILAFGLEQLPTPRRKQELEQLNLARERLFERNLILVFWLNRQSFLDEFRSRASDFWDWRGKVGIFETRHPLIYPYLEWLIAENSYLTMSGVMQVNRQVDIFLDQIYVSLQAERKQQVTTTTVKHQQVSPSKVSSQRQAARSGAADHRLGDEVGLPFAPEEPTELGLELVAVETDTTKTVTEKVDLSDVVRGQYACSVILGAPGAGKTTLLKYLALHFAKARRDGEELVPGLPDQVDLGPTRLPIYFRIADYAEHLEQYPELSLLDYLKQFYRQWEDDFDGGEASDLSTLLLTQMRTGNSLILLDGLDEVFDQTSRQQIVRRINEFAEEFGHNKLIVTSRIAGYQEVKLTGRFTEFTITDMSDDQVSDFLHRWCKAVETAQKPDATPEQWQQVGDQQAELILEDIKKNEGVKRLTANPLLLTILALIHRNGERLPEQRVKLYDLAVQTLTADWQLRKKLPNMQKVLLPEGEVVELLAPLAYWMHEEKPSGQVTHDEVIQQLAPRLADLRGEDADAPEILQAVEEFLRRVRETTGLFVERAPDVYGFMHLTFEEYFAARDIADKDPAEILESIQQHWHEPRWEEPTLLALGFYGSHSPRQFNRLIDKLFRGLEAYQPAPGRDEIKLQGGDGPEAEIQWVKAAEPKQTESFSLKELLFSGQVIAQVGEVNANRRKKLIDKLVVTLLTLDIDGEDAEEKVVKQLLKLLRQIEQFNQQGEVVENLQKVIQETTLSKETRLKAQVTKLYVLCGEASASLADYVTELVQTMRPELFCSLRELMGKVGEEMTPALESLRQRDEADREIQPLTFMAAMTYVRHKHYDDALSLLQKALGTEQHSLRPYVAWSLATCHQGKEEYEKANNFYQDFFEQMADCIEPNAFLVFWENWGVCQRLHGKYEKALECFQHMLDIAKNIQKTKEESLALYHIGRTYKAWGKYREAAAHYEQSRDLDRQLGNESHVAVMWYWLADCYREWGKYEEAISAEQEDLAIRQKLDEQPNVADAYHQLGRIYQDWDKHAEAIAYYEQSRNLYQQLEQSKDAATQMWWLAFCCKQCDRYEQAIKYQEQGLAIHQSSNEKFWMALDFWQLGNIYQNRGKYEEAISYHAKGQDLYRQLDEERNVANQWSNLANCYRAWGKYEQAIEAGQQDLAIRQKLDEQPQIAFAYFQLGHIYQAWGKYSEAINHYEKSRDLYQQLDKESDVADLWYRLADCYRVWGKYEQAKEAEQQDLVIRQKLDEQPQIAFAYFQLGRIYQAWGKHSEAINHYEKSQDLYQQLDKEHDVAGLWYWLADCYRAWGKYEQAIEAEQQDLAIRQKLDDQSKTGLAYFQLGRIYQAWGKCSEAINHYEKSRDLYQQLDKESDIADLWYWLADCYREWGKYEQALAAEQQDLAIRQKLDDQPNIALAHFQLGRIYQAWGKYAEAINHYEQGRDLCKKLGKESDVAHKWNWLAYCYQAWGRYDNALNAERQNLMIQQKLDYQPNIADAYFQLGRIYQTWGKYIEAISYHEQGWSVYENLDLQQEVANQLSWIASCYRELKDYATAIDYYQKSFEKHQALEHTESTAKRLRQLSNTQRLRAKETSQEEATLLLQKAESNLQQAIQLDTAGDYRENLTYDQISLALLIAEQLRWLSQTDPAVPKHISQFEQAATDGFARFAALGQTVDSADEALDIAKAYLEIVPLKDLDKAEALARQSLQTFQDFNRRKLEAAARKLLSEIYLARAQHQESDALEIANEFLTESLSLYRELDLAEKANEVEQLIPST